MGIDAALEDVHTCSWGSVVSYNRASQTAVIQLIQRHSYIDENGERQTERPAPLLDVPVMFPGSGPVSITWDINSGDVVLVLFAERSMDGWYHGGQADVDSGDDRRHSMSDAIAIPGLRSSQSPIPGPPPANAVVITCSDIRLGDLNANQPTLLGNSYNNALTTFLAAINAYAAGIKSNADPSGAATAALTTAITLFQNTLVTCLTGKVKVK